MKLYETCLPRSGARVYWAAPQRESEDSWRPDCNGRQRDNAVSITSGLIRPLPTPGRLAPFSPVAGQAHLTPELTRAERETSSRKIPHDDEREAIEASGSMSCSGAPPQAAPAERAALNLLFYLTFQRSSRRAPPLNSRNRGRDKLRRSTQADE
jgi:hypothetical protein